MATTTTKRRAGNDGAAAPDPRHLAADQVLDARITALLAEAARVEAPAKEIREAQKRAEALRAQAGALRKCRDAAGWQVFDRPEVAKVERRLDLLAADLQYEADLKLIAKARIPPTQAPVNVSWDSKPVVNERWLDAERDTEAAHDKKKRLRAAREKWVAAVKAGTAPAAAEAELRSTLQAMGVVL
jgi:hypothetical protein